MKKFWRENSWKNNVEILMLFLVQWHICGKFSNARKILLCSSSPADVIFSLFLQWPKELEVHTLIWSRHRKRKTFQRGVWRHVQKKGKDQKSPRLGVNPDQSKILNSDTYVLSGLVTLNKKLKNFTRVFFCGFFPKRKLRNDDEDAKLKPQS